MNRALIEAAELRLGASAAWRALHAQLFGELLAPGPGAELGLIWMWYFAWCQERGVWCSQAVMERQLIIAGYHLDGEWVSDVKITRDAKFERKAYQDIEAARAFLGIPAGLLGTLREFEAGPAFEQWGGKTFYARKALNE
jgi:hypothetical protein